MMIFTFLSIICIGETIAQVSGNEIYSKKKTYSEVPRTSFIQENEIILEANVLYNSIAESYVVIFNLNQVGETAEIASQLIDTRVEGVKQSIIKLGINERDIYIDMLTFVPEYEYEVQKKIFSKTFNEVPKGFRIQKNIHIKYTDSRLLDKMVAICAKHEIYDLVKVEYFNQNSNAYYDTLRKEAKKILKAKLNNYKELGINIESAFKRLAENTFVKYPGEQYASYKAFNSSSMEALKKNSGVTQVKKTSSFYYKPVSYKNYDLVINPLITEPVIQYAYSIRMRLELNKPTEKTEEVYLLTPNGDLKLIDK